MTPRGETGFILTFQDVTESRKLEREARVQQRLAAVGEMAAGIAHEIRNPLASMSGSIQILRAGAAADRRAGPADGHRHSRVRAAERDDPQLPRLRAAAAAVDDGTWTCARCVTDTATLLQNSAERGEAHRIAVDVPAEPVQFQADEGQIRQIVWNLATNGLRAMPDGGTLTLGGDAADRGPRRTW